MKSKKAMWWTLCGLFLVVCASYLSRTSDLRNNILFLIPPFIAFLAAAGAAKTYGGLRNVHGRVMMYFACGLGCLFIGEFIFFLFQFVFHIDPYPSVADAYYLAAYPLLFAGFLREIRLHNVRWGGKNRFVLLLMATLLAALAVIVCYFGVYKAYHTGDSFASNAISISYGLGDLILIGPSLIALKIALDYKGGRLFTTWGLLLLAILAMMAGDILYAINRNSYDALIWPYTLIDLAWAASYLLFAASFLFTRRTIKDLNAKLSH